ncbi:hypothetical protein RJ527_08750 [Thalassospiraceae bacterium LMO-SO8]|nr:hypothetical protein [Alphaproteobacteria bacterium LMO-S08]WND77819.1 hypothetical protein RJ527_08750 [Thalassospiraceae bacterium LMO-SO8]
MRPPLPNTPTWRLDPFNAAGEFRHVAATGPGRFPRDRSGNADIQGFKIEKHKADLLESALKTRGLVDQDAFSERLRRQGSRLEERERDLFNDLAANWFESSTDKEFEAVAAKSLETLANREPRDTIRTTATGDAPGGQWPAEPKDGDAVNDPKKEGDSSAQSAPSSPDRLQAELDAASRNRRAAVDRAMDKEAEFQKAKNAVNEAWDRIGREAAKAGIQLVAVLAMKRGRVGSPGLAAALAERDQAEAETRRLQDELHALRQDVAAWDEEIRAILTRMRGGKPMG